jgi:UDP-N-acetylglucosamine--N-acetylmuramyl-(pentapeptide) pyrophosphoryl-undecaprenol N-acetylglucosamine transferase
MTRVAFLCCHLSGTGHLVRTLALAHATAAAGAQVLVIGGGRPLDHIDLKGIDFLQLPPVQVPDFDFSTLRKPDGEVADDAYLASRRSTLHEALTNFRADALVTELFPLGRRILAVEFEAAIAATRAANPAAAIIASVRDIPEPPSKPARLEQAAERLRRLYTALLVHGDADFLPLSATWPLPDDLTPMIHHTGYVANDPPPPCDTPGKTILVAVGGGVLGRNLLALAAQAAALSPRPWHLLTGGPDAADLARDLTAQYGRANLTIEPARPDYKALLANAACSVSLAGYNTVLDLAACDTPAIIVPFDEHGEREQVIRAERLAQCGGFTIQRAASLTPAALATVAEIVAIGPRRKPLPLARDGATRAAEKILEVAARCLK